MLFGITAMILVGSSWTVCGYVMGKAPKEKVEIPLLLFYSMSVTLLLSLISGSIQGFPQTTAKGMAIVAASQILSGLFNFWQLEWMSKAMQKGNNGIVWSIVQSGFIFPFFMGILFFGVPLTWVRLLAFLAALASVALFGLAQGGKGSGVLLTAFSAFFMTGISQSLSNLPSYFPEAETVSSIWRTAGVSCGFLLGTFSCKIGSFAKFCQEIPRAASNKKIWKFTFLMVGLELFAHYFLLFPGMDSLSKANAGAIAYPLMVCACLLVFDLISLFILKEKHRPVQWAALFLCLLGVVGLSLG